MLGVGLIPLIAFPILEFSEKQVWPNGTMMIITVENIGFTSAKNLVVSLHADNANFFDLRSEPYLPGDFKTNINSLCSRSTVITDPVHSNLCIHFRSGYDTDTLA